MATKKPTSSPTSPAAIDASSCAAAVKLLRDAYRQHVERLALELKPRLLAGEFSGWYRDDTLMRFDALERVVAAVPRPWGDHPLLTIALASQAARDLGGEAYDEDNYPALERFMIAWDVREFAIARWGLERDGVWERLAANERIRHVAAE